MEARLRQALEFRGGGENMVPEARLELAWLSPQHFECCVYTSSTTPAGAALRSNCVNLISKVSTVGLLVVAANAEMVCKKGWAIAAPLAFNCKFDQDPKPMLKAVM